MKEPGARRTASSTRISPSRGHQPLPDPRGPPAPLGPLRPRGAPRRGGPRRPARRDGHRPGPQRGAGRRRGRGGRDPAPLRGRRRGRGHGQRPLGRHLPPLRRTRHRRPAHPRARALRRRPPRGTPPTTSSTRSSATSSISRPSCATPSSSSCPWPPSAGPTAPASAPSAGPIATRATVAALPPGIPGGLTSTCSGSPSRRACIVPERRGAPNRPEYAHRSLETVHGCPEEEEVQGQGSQPPGRGMAPGASGPERVPALPGLQDPPRGLPQLRLVQGSPGRRGRLT